MKLEMIKDIASEIKTSKNNIALQLELIIEYINKSNSKNQSKYDPVSESFKNKFNLLINNLCEIEDEITYAIKNESFNNYQYKRIKEKILIINHQSKKFENLMYNKLFNKN